MTEAPKPRRVLLVSPVFHGYWAAIRDALEARGHTVIVHRYDESTNVLERVQNKLVHDAPGTAPARAARRAITDRAITALHAARAEALLVVKGDLLDARWWQAVADARLPTVLWLYDELERMDYALDLLREIGPIASYSPRDVDALVAEGIAASHVPLGFDSLTGITRRDVDAVTFVGARYPGREQLLRQLADASIPVKAYGREWSRHPWDVIRTRRFSDIGIPTGRDLPRSESYGVMAGSLATLNVHGDGQNGFTMRTFEAPGVAGLQLVDRPDVEMHYEVGKEALVFTSTDELIEHATRARREPRWAASVRDAGRARTLAEHTLMHRVAVVEEQWH